MEELSPQQFDRLQCWYWWWEGFMKYVVEMGSGGMLYIPSFLEIGSGIQKLLWGDTHTDTQTTWWSHRFTFIFLGEVKLAKNKMWGKRLFVGFEVLTVVTIKETIFWVVKSYILLEFHRRFQWTYPLHLLVTCLLLVSYLAWTLTLQMKAINTTETVADLYRTTWHYNPGHHSLQGHHSSHLLQGPLSCFVCVLVWSVTSLELLAY
jgi:hypothetical protein